MEGVQFFQDQLRLFELCNPPLENNPVTVQSAAVHINTSLLLYEPGRVSRDSMWDNSNRTVLERLFPVFQSDQGSSVGWMDRLLYQFGVRKSTQEFPALWEHMRVLQLHGLESQELDCFMLNAEMLKQLYTPGGVSSENLSYAAIRAELLKLLERIIGQVLINDITLDYSSRINGSPCNYPEILYSYLYALYYTQNYFTELKATAGVDGCSSEAALFKDYDDLLYVKYNGWPDYAPEIQSVEAMELLLAPDSPFAAGRQFPLRVVSPMLVIAIATVPSSSDYKGKLMKVLDLILNDHGICVQRDSRYDCKRACDVAYA